LERTDKIFMQMKKVCIGSGIIGGALLLLILMRICVAWLYSEELPRSYFDDYAAVKASGLIERGWIPPYIPKSVTNVVEQHDLDSNDVTMSFTYRIGDTASTRQACGHEKTLRNGLRVLCTYGNTSTIR
jgi:hypothetical protein